MKPKETINKTKKAKILFKMPIFKNKQENQQLIFEGTNQKDALSTMHKAQERGGALMHSTDTSLTHFRTIIS